jgi:hypothetical protein
VPSNAHEAAGRKHFVTAVHFSHHFVNLLAIAAVPARRRDHCAELSKALGLEATAHMLILLAVCFAERWGKYLELEEQTYQKAVQLAADARGAQNFFSVAMDSLAAAFSAVAQQYAGLNGGSQVCQVFMSVRSLLLCWSPENTCT